MAKPLVFQWGEQDLAFTLNKIDRSKLYGFKEVEVLDEQQRTCELATLDSDGRTVVGRGGTGLGTLDVDGRWREKAELKPIGIDGEELKSVPSSYSAPIKLFETVSADEFLKHNIRLVYQVETDSDISSLREELKRDTIFSFPYSFRGGLEADAGFLLMGSDGHVFITVGNPTQASFIGLQQTATVMDDEDGMDETDLMDFDMI
jgi:hypothetical protein